MILRDKYTGLTGARENHGTARLLRRTTVRRAGRHLVLRGEAVVPDLGFGCIVVSETKAPNMFLNLV